MISSGNARCMMDLNASKKCNLYLDEQGNPLAYVCEGTATEFNKCYATGHATEE
jgi:hypothetical protein